MQADLGRRPIAAEAQAWRDEAARPVLERLRRDAERASRRIRPLVEHVAQHLFDRGLSYERMREALSIRDSNRSTAFRGELGSTPAEYARHARMEVAEALLGGSRLDVAGIATLVGYRPEAFSAAFKRWAGATPRVYRDLCRRHATAEPVGAERPGLQPSGWRRLREGTLPTDEALDVIELILARYPEARRRLVEGVAAELSLTAGVVDRVEQLVDQLRISVADLREKREARLNVTH